MNDLIDQLVAAQKELVELQRQEKIITDKVRAATNRTFEIRKQMNAWISDQVEARSSFSDNG